VNEPGYVARQWRRNKGPFIKPFYNKRQLDNEVAELQSAKWKKLREGTTNSTYGDTCDYAKSHFAADADRSGQPSHVRIVALESILATAICLCPFGISEVVSCRWSGIPFDVDNHVRVSHDSENFKGTGESEWIRMSLSVVQTYQRAIFTSDKLFSKLC
jgi:hypothetical protein